MHLWGLFNRYSGLILKTFILGSVLFCYFNSFETQARSVVTPWTSELGFQNLVYGASSTSDVVQIMGRYPDDLVKSEQMYPLVENYYYYEEGGTGAGTVFVFENGFLVGLLYKSSQNQYMDFTYFLPNNGDRTINNPILGRMRSYYPNLPLFWW